MVSLSTVMLYNEDLRRQLDHTYIKDKTLCEVGAPTHLINPRISLISEISGKVSDIDVLAS